MKSKRSSCKRSSKSKNQHCRLITVLSRFQYTVRTTKSSYTHLLRQSQGMKRLKRPPLLIIEITLLNLAHNERTKLFNKFPDGHFLFSTSFYWPLPISKVKYNLWSEACCKRKNTSCSTIGYIDGHSRWLETVAAVKSVTFDTFRWRASRKLRSSVFLFPSEAAIIDVA